MKTTSQMLRDRILMAIHIGVPEVTLDKLLDDYAKAVTMEIKYGDSLKEIREIRESVKASQI